MPQPESGLTSADVEEAIRAAMAEIPQSVEGLTKAEVEQIVQTAIASIPEPRAGLTSAEAEQIARGVVASIPPKSAPPEYTRFFVENAISRYETHGLDATLAYYNREGNIDGQWYVFIIIDENDLVIGHPDAHRLGLDLKGSVGTDANGYNFGQDMLAAGEEGRYPKLKPRWDLHFRGDDHKPGCPDEALPPIHRKRSAPLSQGIRHMRIPPWL